MDADVNKESGPSLLEQRTDTELRQIMRASIYAAEQARDRAVRHQNVAMRAVDRAAQSHADAKEAANRAEVASRSAARAALVARAAAESIMRNRTHDEGVTL